MVKIVRLISTFVAIGPVKTVHDVTISMAILVAHAHLVFPVSGFSAIKLCILNLKYFFGNLSRVHPSNSYLCNHMCDIDRFKLMK